MTLTTADSLTVERVRGNLTAFERIVHDPGESLNAAEWSGVFSFNVEELLDIIDRLAAREPVPYRWPSPEPPYQWPVPTGTGWPVT